MAITKFHEKNVSLFSKLEAVSGTYLAPAATDATPVTSMSGSATYETDSYTYLGSDLSRDEFTYVNDSYSDFTTETPQQILGVLNPSLLVSAVPLSNYFQACGGFITVNGTTGVVTIDNATVSDSSISIDYRKTSSEDLVNDKLFRFPGCRGSVDIEASIGKLPLLKFTFKGNVLPPIASPRLVGNPAVLAKQFKNVAPSIRQATIVTSSIVPFGEPSTARVALPGTVTTITRVNTTATVTMSSAHNLTDGRLVRISGSVDPLYNGDFEISVLSATTFSYQMTGTPAANATGTLVAESGGYAQTFCFSKLSAPNFFGFDYERYLTGCEEGFAKGAVPTDVSVTMLEDQVGGTSFDPDLNISKFFEVTVKFGTTAGKFVTYKWNKLQISDVKEDKVAKYFGRAVTFRNTGNSFIILE